MTTNAPSSAREATSVTSNGAPRRRSAALAERLERGAQALIALAQDVSDAEWRTPVPGDGRTVGVLIHHVASQYSLEIPLAQTLASGQPITGVTWADVHALNARHAAENFDVTRDAAIALLRANSEMAAEAVRAMTDAELDNAAPVSLNADAPLTCQFFIEDHALRHSYHHLARIRSALGR